MLRTSPARRAAVRCRIDAVLGTPAEEHSRRSGARAQGLPVVEPIAFELDDALRARVRSAADAFAAQPALYRSPGWLTMRDDYLSTSSAPSHNIQYFGFGSTSSRRFGVAYVLLPELRALLEA